MGISNSQKSQQSNPYGIPTIQELQHSLTLKEIESTQKDPNILMIPNDLINNDKDQYLSLLLQNGAKLPQGFDVTMILPPRITLGKNSNQLQNATQTQAMTSSSSKIASTSSTQATLVSNTSYQESALSSTMNVSTQM